MTGQDAYFFPLSINIDVEFTESLSRETGFPFFLIFTFLYIEPELTLPNLMSG
jgi:hypothetical protein